MLASHRASKDLELETTYAQLLKETSSHEKSISRDLSRTFPGHDYFRDPRAGGGIGQENLYVLFPFRSSYHGQETDYASKCNRFNVVKAYSLYDEEVGYTQGLQFIVGPLLLNVRRSTPLFMRSDLTMECLTMIDARRRSVLCPRSTDEIIRSPLALHSQYARITAALVPV